MSLPDLLATLASARVYDLEQPRYAGAPTFPAHEPGLLLHLHRRHEAGLGERRTSASALLVMAEHSGTHVDALCHQAEDLHLFGGVGMLFIVVGVVICAYLAILRLAGEAIGGRPLLLLGVLLIVVGVQLFTIGLVSEMIQRYHLRPQDDEARSRVERVIR